MNLLAKLKAEALINYFLHTTSSKMSDYSKVELPTAKLFALKLCSEIKGHMGADRGYLFWTDVEDYVKAY